jgi:hypothetical protein
MDRPVELFWTILYSEWDEVKYVIDQSLTQRIKLGLELVDFVGQVQQNLVDV